MAHKIACWRIRRSVDLRGVKGSGPLIREQNSAPARRTPVPTDVRQWRRRHEQRVLDSVAVQVALACHLPSLGRFIRLRRFRAK